MRRPRRSPIQRVDVGHDGAKWLPAGVIQLSPSADPGTLFHEIFHTVFHRSALHAGQDERWGEGFCDAFRFVTERELLPGPPSDRVKKVERYPSMSFAEVMAKSGEPVHDRKYAYPASVIPRRTGLTTKGLRKLWLELNALREARGADVLDAFFGSDAGSGRRTAPLNAVARARTAPSLWRISQEIERGSSDRPSVTAGRACQSHRT